MTSKVFLSYSSKDRPEVEQLDLELRRRGVPLWRDRSDLAEGRVAQDEIERAARDAAGFAFYLTQNAAQSEWVREKERGYALQNSKRDGSFGILPIYRGDMGGITAEMKARGVEPSRPGEPSPYDLTRFNGYIFDVDAVAEGRKDDQIRAATAAVLNSLLNTLAERRGSGARLRIGAATRGGPKLFDFDLDLLMDWTYDYPPHQTAPNPGTAETTLNPALSSLCKAIRKSWQGTALQIVPQCHLTMALALGFEFRRNTGYNLDVVEIHSQAHWAGPAKPLPPDYQYWSWSKSRPVGSGTGIALVIQISQPIDAVIEKNVIKASGVDVGYMLVFEPDAGPSKTALQPSDPLAVHQMVVAVTETLTQKRSEGLRGPVHIFAAVPAPFAVLLGQQLSNLGLVQSYEWSDGEGKYASSFRFESS